LKAMQEKNLVKNGKFLIKYGIREYGWVGKSAQLFLIPLSPKFSEFFLHNLIFFENWIFGRNIWYTVLVVTEFFCFYFHYNNNLVVHGIFPFLFSS